MILYISISRFPPRRQQRIFAFPPPCGRATAAFPGHETAPSSSRASTGNRGCGCRDCVLPSSAPGSGRPQSPARKLVRRLKASFSAQRRGDLKEGVSPSFIVSIRGVKRGKKSKSSPSCVLLFSSPFLLDKQEKRGAFPPSFARAQRKWTPTRAKGHRSGQRDTGRSADEASGLTNPKRKTIITSEKGELGIPG